MIGWMKKMLKGCPKEDILIKYLEATLSEGEAEKTEAHLADCPDCREVALCLAQTEEENPSYATLNRALMIALGKRENVIDFVLRIKDKAIEVIETSAEKIAFDAVPVGALRGVSDAKNASLYARSLGLYSVYVAFEPASRESVGMHIALKGPATEGKNFIFSLCDNEREVMTVHAKNGTALFDGVSPGKYSLKISENHAEIGALNLRLTN